MTNDEAPLPCPWCGSQAEIGENDDNGSAPWLCAWVRCTKRPGCEAEGATAKLPKTQDARAAAIAAWNRVARLAAQGAAVEGAREATIHAVLPGEPGHVKVVAEVAGTAHLYGRLLILAEPAREER